MENRYSHESKGVFGCFVEVLCNASALRAFRRSVFRFFPFVKMESEVENVVYLNWLVDIEKAKALVPERVELLDFDGKTLFTILTYQHNNFRPSFLGFLKSIFPSPRQSNWRLYVKSIDDEEVEGVVLFLKNVMSSLLYTIATRLASDAMQTHFSSNFEHRVVNGSVQTAISPTEGSAPKIESLVRFSDVNDIPANLVNFLGGEKKVLEFICDQHAAISIGDDFDGLCRADIVLPIDVNEIVAADVESVEIGEFKDLIQGARPFSFVVPRVSFTVQDEYIIK